MYNLLSTKLLLQQLRYSGTRTTCDVLYKSLHMHLHQSSLAVQFQELIGHVGMTFGGAPNWTVPIWDHSPGLKPRADVTKSPKQGYQ